ncbi:hypothetical protein J4Q44_G00329780 [Coregonus suidteri]|uniref:Bromo domain-containing protein n=1 Tax=Coregonus suidteri TaxID=861788 RepID=A0AAN8KXX2_9TELE
MPPVLVLRDMVRIDKLILCDECNKAFHLFCLRPALYRILKGSGCAPPASPPCKDAAPRKMFFQTYSVNYNEDTEEEEDSEDEAESESEDSDEEDEEDKDYKAMGHSLRSRKKTKHSKASKASSKGGSKKHSPPSKPSKPRAAPSSPAEIDEMVRQSSKTGVRRQALELERSEEILQKLVKFRYSWPFREPVSVEEAEDYFDIISSPMDFQTMQAKFSEGQYRHAQELPGGRQAGVLQRRGVQPAGQLGALLHGQDGAVLHRAAPQAAARPQLPAPPPAEESQSDPSGLGG